MVPEICWGLGVFRGNKIYTNNNKNAKQNVVFSVCLLRPGKPSMWWVDTLGYNTHCRGHVGSLERHSNVRTSWFKTLNSPLNSGSPLVPLTIFVSIVSHYFLIIFPNRFNPFGAAVPFWGQTTWKLNVLSPKRD